MAVRHRKKHVLMELLKQFLFFLAKLAALDLGGQQRIQVVLENPSSELAFERLVNGLGELRWVENPERSSYAVEKAAAIVTYPEKVVYLAADVDYLPGYTVVSYGPGYVVVREEG